MPPSPKSVERSNLEGPNLQRANNDGEMHSGSGDIIRDVIIGFADGLTVPFALTAGLSSQVATPAS